jgi:predicted DNA-binding protein
MRDTTLNKDYKLTVRLNPHQKQELERLSEATQIKKAKLARYAIQELIEKWK